MSVNCLIFEKNYIHDVLFFLKKIFFYSIWHSFGFCVILEMLPKLTFCKCHLDFLCRALSSVLIEKCET